MELREWEAAAVDSGEGPPESDEWIAVETPSASRFAGERAVAYRTTFADPRKGTDRALLELRGLHSRGRVWLNDAFCGVHDTPFTPFRTAFDPEERNELVVACRAPEPHDAGTTLDSTERDTPGVRWGATVEPVPETVITDLTVGHYESGDESGVNAIVTIDAGSALHDRIAFSLRPAGTEGASAVSRVGITADAGERVTVRGQLTVSDPDRWWSHGFGSQNRYVVHAALGESERTAKTGFRTVEYGDDGLSVNGTRVPVRGWCPRAATPETVERAVAANATLVRLSGFVPSEAFYDAADEAGILVQQDVPLAPDTFDAEHARRVARILAGAYSHHPSLVAFGIRDDAYGFASVTDEGDRHALRATGGDESGATARTAAAALSDAVPVFPVPGLDAGPDGVATADAWVLDGYAGTDDAFDAGAHTRYVVSGADADASTRAGNALDRLRLVGRPFVTARPPDAGNGIDAIEAAFEPIRVFLDDSTPETRLVVVNDTTDPVTGDLEWAAGDAGGTFAVDICPLSRTVLGDIDLPADARRVEVSIDDETSVIGR